MNEQEIKEEIAILDMAARRAGQELEQMGAQHLRIHAQKIAVMARKLDILEAASAALMSKPEAALP